MKADLWWRSTLGVGLAGATSLGVAAFAPLLIRAAPVSGTPGDGTFDLVCLFMPTRSDWAAHLVSYAILLLLTVGAGRGLISLATQLLQTHRVLRALRGLARPLDEDLQPIVSRLQLTGRIDLCRTSVPLAFCYGLFRPRICVSTGLVAALHPDELAAILWHERAHLLRHDPLKVLLGRVCSATFFFLPLARALYRQYLLAKEVEADGYACRQQGSAEPLTGALCVLLDLAPAAGRPATPRAAAGSADELETRVDYLLGSAPRWQLPVGSLLVTGMLLVTLIGLELALTQASVTTALWSLTHHTVNGC